MLPCRPYSRYALSLIASGRASFCTTHVCKGSAVFQNLSIDSELSWVYYLCFTVHCSILDTVAPRYSIMLGYLADHQSLCYTPSQYVPFESTASSSLTAYHHLLEFLPLVAHCKQCRVEDTTAQVPHTFLPQSLHAKGLCSTAPPISMSMSTSMLSPPLCSGVSQSSHRGSCDEVCSCCMGIEKIG